MDKKRRIQVNWRRLIAMFFICLVIRAVGIAQTGYPWWAIPLDTGNILLQIIASLERV